MLHSDGRLGVIDFGAAAPFPDGLPPVLGTMVRLALHEQFDELTELLHANGFVLPGRTVTDKEIADYLRPLTDPIRTESFHFTRAWLQKAAGTATDFNSAQFRTARALSLPPEYLMIFRVLVGSVGICAQLDAYAPYMAILTRWLPGFDDPTQEGDGTTVR
jgi:predicted unusual protein kinase regulating ubiquinone biosynthesis (AarF/ABC1/UbiB family)